MRETFAVADGITAIDTKMIGRYLVTSAYLLDADEPILVETGPAASADAVDTGLRDVGVSRDELAHVVVTHIHLDHAGGVGTLAGRYPNATLWVHERGARHLADPTKLVASAARVFGEERMRRYFGEMVPAPPDRLRALEDGDLIDVGGRSLDVIETPGHASHHLCLIDSRTGAVFTGDALGVHLPEAGVLRPATPPPEFDIELACESIERIRARADSILLLSHFGPVGDVDRVCTLAADRIRRWGDVVRRALAAGEDAERVTSLLGEEGAAEYLRDSSRPIDLDAYDVLSSVRANADGLIRYWRKRMEREGEDVLRTAEATPPTSSG
jgi:glyoxylase-like metal-dependent hydrolase (beta-lactamase superfamily II)